MEFAPVECPRVRLRAFTEDDLETFAAYRADPEIARYQSWSSYSVADARALYAEQLAKPFGREGEWYQIAIADRENDGLLGDLALHVISADEVEVGFTLAPACQGRGYAREALGAFLAYLFGPFGCRRVIAVTDTRNRQAISLLEASGFDRRAQTRSITFKGGAADEFIFERWRESDSTERTR